MSMDLVTFLRISVVILSGETAVRYLFWWLKTRRLADALLPNLMLGIAVVHWMLACMMGMGTVHIFGFGNSKPDGWVYTTLIAGIVGGTFYHLVPCWRISCKLKTGWILVNLALRLAGAFLLATIL